MKIYAIVKNIHREDPAYMGDDDAEDFWQELYPKLYTEEYRAKDAARSLDKLVESDNNSWQEVYYTVVPIDVDIPLVPFEDRRGDNPS